MLAARLWSRARKRCDERQQRAAELDAPYQGPCTPCKTRRRVSHSMHRPWAFCFRATTCQRKGTFLFRVDTDFRGRNEGQRLVCGRSQPMLNAAFIMMTALRKRRTSQWSRYRPRGTSGPISASAGRLSRLHPGALQPNSLLSRSAGERAFSPSGLASFPR